MRKILTVIVNYSKRVYTSCIGFFEETSAIFGFTLKVLLGIFSIGASGLLASEYWWSVFISDVVLFIVLYYVQIILIGRRRLILTSKKMKNWAFVITSLAIVVIIQTLVLPWNMMIVGVLWLIYMGVIQKEYKRLISM